MEKNSQDKRFEAKEIEKELAKQTLEKTQNLLFEVDSLYSSFDYVKLSVASSDRILSWSLRDLFISHRSGQKSLKREIGEVTNSETVKFTDFSPIPGGLFCQNIFGPLKTGICSCGNRYEKYGFGTVCPKCYVEFTESRVRRYRMGVFPLFVPACHIWFLKGRPSYLQQILGISKKLLEKTVYYKEIFLFRNFSKLSEDEKSSTYLMYKEVQPIPYNPDFTSEFCFFTANFSSYRNGYFNEVLDFLVSNELKFKKSVRLLKRLKKRYSSKGANEIENYIKRRLSTLIEKSQKLLKTILAFKIFLKANYKIIPESYSYEDLDEKVIQDFTDYYRFLTRKKGKQYPFEKKYLYSIENIFDSFSKATSQQNNLFNDSKANISKKNFYDRFAKTLLLDYYLKKFSGKHRKRYNGELIYALLQNVDLDNEAFVLRNSLVNIREVKIKSLKSIKRLRILESFIATQTSPTSLMLTNLPILPPTLRPLQELENGKIISADLNEVYRLIILRTNRILSHNIFLWNAKEFSTFKSQIARYIQEALDCLIDNARVSKRKQMLVNNRPLKTLTEILEGKEGRFRQTLLGKRVDYSGRSVIVVGPELKINQCGLPFEMAKILFEPFLISLLLELKLELEKIKVDKGLHKANLEIYKSFSYKRFLRMLIQKNKPLIWSLLFKLSQEYSILLNRAPTLHKFGIQAFDPLIVLGEAIQLHPLVCPGFNADFDGDQMAVHLPLYYASQLEIKSFLKSSSNVFSPANGEVILKPSQDIVIGSYYLTFMNEKSNNRFPAIFGNKKEVLLALANKKIQLQDPILVRYSIYNLSFYIQENKLIFSQDFFSLWQEKVEILEILNSLVLNEKLYLLTSKGVLIGKKVTMTKYLLVDYFFETTPGRILFGFGINKSRAYL